MIILKETHQPWTNKNQMRYQIRSVYTTATWQNRCLHVHWLLLFRRQQSSRILRTAIVYIKFSVYFLDRNHSITYRKISTVQQIPRSQETIVFLPLQQAPPPLGPEGRPWSAYVGNAWWMENQGLLNLSKILDFLWSINSLFDIQYTWQSKYDNVLGQIFLAEARVLR